MDQHIIDLIQRETKAYAKAGLNGVSYFTRSDDGKIYTVVSLGFLPGKRVLNTALLVRLEGDFILIEQDINDKPLVDALVQAGVPRERIILAYAGEKLPPSVAPLPGEHLVDRR